MNSESEHASQFNQWTDTENNLLMTEQSSRANSPKKNELVLDRKYRSEGPAETGSRRSSRFFGKYKDIRERLDTKLDWIKRQLRQRRERSRADILVNTVMTRQKEKRMANLASRKSYARWRKIQGMLAFLSFLRKTLRQARNFGLDVSRDSSHDIIYLSYPRPPLLITKKDVLFRIHAKILFLITVLMIFLIPLEIAFKRFYEITTVTYIDLVISLYYVIDIVINLYTAIEIQASKITDISTIRKTYFKYYFISDLLSALPLEFILLVSYNYQVAYIIVLQKVWRVANALTLKSQTKIGSRQMFISYLKGAIHSSNRIYVVLSLITTMIIIHASACLWCFISSFNPGGWRTR
jgi:predicted NUDIX family phosphoesterase